MRLWVFPETCPSSSSPPSSYGHHQQQGLRPVEGFFLFPTTDAGLGVRLWVSVEPPETKEMEKKGKLKDVVVICVFQVKEQTAADAFI